jgi:dTDP-glucose pyrophosphorylase
MMGGIRRLAFGIQREADRTFNLAARLEDLYSEFSPAVVVLDGFTEGAACTVLEILSCLEGDFVAEEPLMIHLADVAFTADLERAMRGLPAECCGAVPAFPSQNPKFSYLKTGSDGRVTMTAEKQVISSLASAGCYYFKRTHDFEEAARSAIAAEEKVRGAYFICPLYNQLIRMRKIVMPIRVNYVANLGDAGELEAFAREGRATEGGLGC